MSKMAKFKINHCCLCEENEMRLGRDSQEFWCLILNRKLNEEEYANFPEDCPKPDIFVGLKDLEEYLIERTP